MPDNQPAPVAAPPDELAAKQAQLKAAQDQIAALNKNISSLHDDIKNLSQKVAEIKQATAGYPALQQSMQDELDKDRGQITKPSEIAKAVLKDATKQIDATVDAFDKDLATGDANVTAAGDKAKKAADDAYASAADVQTKQAKYDGLRNGTAKDTPKFNQNALKEVDTLLAAMNKAETQSDFVAVYFLSTEVKKKTDAINILSPDDYATQLKNAQSDLDNAKATARDKKQAAEDASKAYTDSQHAQQAKWQSRIPDLLAKLKGAGQKAAA